MNITDCNHPDNSAIALLCGQNHDPQLWEFAHRCYQAGRRSGDTHLFAGGVIVAMMGLRQIKLLADDWSATHNKPIDSLPVPAMMRRIHSNLDQAMGWCEPMEKQAAEYCKELTPAAGQAQEGGR